MAGYCGKRLFVHYEAGVGLKLAVRLDGSNFFANDCCVGIFFVAFLGFFYKKIFFFLAISTALAAYCPRINYNKMRLQKLNHKPNNVKVTRCKLLWFEAGF